MSRAEEIAERIFWEMQRVSSFSTRKATLADALRDYAKEEQERCAKIAEGYMIGRIDNANRWQAAARKVIAARIREGDTKANADNR